MKAIFQNRYGKIDVLEYGEQPKPELKKDQVLVRNYASSINPRDWMIRSGRYQLQFLVPSFPLILGSDFSGEVVAIGRAVKKFKLGDRVFGMKNPSQGLGSYAEYLVVKERHAVSIPDELSHIDAAGIPLCALTSWQALVHKAKIKRGMKVLVIGASGGVGSYAIQIAKLMGTSITGVCSGANSERVRALGADNIVDYTQDDFLKLDARYDIIFDTIGRHSLKKCTQVLTKDGCYVSTVPSPNNIKSMISTAVLSTILPFKPQQRTQLVMVKSSAKDLAIISQMVSEQKIKPVIDRVFPLAQVGEAHDYSRSLRAKGKIILSID